MQVHCFRPHLVLFAGPHQLRNKQALGICADVIHQTCWRVLGKQDSKVGVNTVVGALERHSDFEETNKFILVPELFVMYDYLFQVVGVNDDLLTTKRSHAEFFCADTGETDGLPDFGNVCLLGRVVGSLVLLEHNVGLCEFLIVVDPLVQNLCRQEKSCIVTAVTAFLDISLVRFAHEFFKVIQESLASHRITENKLRVNSLFFLLLAGHQEIVDQIFVVLLALCECNNSFKVLCILGSDKCID